jgi:ATP-binding protein involved in chromosome partitioning
MKTYRDIASDGGSGIVAQVTEQANRLRARLGSVRHVVAVMSGKGGVGKSAVTVNLAAALALEGAAVGLLDADINGPSLAKMTGVRGQRLDLRAEGLQPAVAALGLRVMSMDLFLPGEDAPVVWDAPTQQDAYTWRGTMEMTALRELLSDTAWGALEVLLVDLPPGADRLPNLVDLLPRLSGTLIVTLPSGVSRFVVGKSLAVAESLPGAPVIGLVENMSTYVCPCCGREEALFPGGATEALAARHGVPFLGRIPFDPRLAAAADAGRPFMIEGSDTPAGRAIRHVADGVRQFLAGAPVSRPLPCDDHGGKP